MRVRRGYTIVEIIIVLAIMLVLLVLGVVTLNNTAIRHILPGLSEDSYQYPSRSGQQALFVQSPSNGISKDSATVDRFVYEPRTRDGSLCVTTSQECSRFFLYYRLERAPTVTITITSNHQ